MLAQANQRWHHILDTCYQDFLESLTALEFTDADAQWHYFCHLLRTHIGFERTHIEPLTERWQDNTLKLIRADHLILERLLTRLEKTYAEIRRSEAARHEMVRELDGFIKLRNVLEHHDLREKETLYPLLDQQLDKEQLSRLTSDMDKARTQLTA